MQRSAQIRLLKAGKVLYHSTAIRPELEKNGKTYRHRAIMLSYEDLAIYNHNKKIRKSPRPVELPFRVICQGDKSSLDYNRTIREIANEEPNAIFI